jgi:hypothetical protein
MKALKLVSYVILLLSVFSSAIPVYADTAQPNSVTLDSPKVFRDLIQTDDMLVVIPYNIAYTVLPNLDIDRTFIFRLLDTDNVTELGACLAYPAYTRGYGKGVVSMYFDNVTAPAWGLNYPIRVDENPSAFTSPVYFNFSLNAGDYSVVHTKEANQGALYSEVIRQAQSLSVTWSVALTDNSGGSTVLSALGENYFRNAIPALDTLCPRLFYIQVTSPVYTKRTWSYTFANLLSNTFSGTFMMTGEQGLADLFGIGRQTMWGIVTLLLCVLAMWFCSRERLFSFSQVNSRGVTNEKWPIQQGFIDFAVVLIFATLLGWFSPTFHALIAFLFVMMGGVVLFLNRA